MWKAGEFSIESHKGANVIVLLQLYQAEFKIQISLRRNFCGLHFALIAAREKKTGK